MTHDIPEVAERLAREFADVPPKVVMEAVCSCAGECESASPLYLEAAARASLSAHACRPADISPV
jgi:hypothetical protein